MQVRNALIIPIKNPEWSVVIIVAALAAWVMVESQPQYREGSIQINAKTKTGPDSGF